MQDALWSTDRKFDFCYLLVYFISFGLPHSNLIKWISLHYTLKIYLLRSQKSLMTPSLPEWWAWVTVAAWSESVDKKRAAVLHEDLVHRVVVVVLVGLVLDPHDARTIVVTLFCSKKIFVYVTWHIWDNTFEFIISKCSPYLCFILSLLNKFCLIYRLDLLRFQVKKRK